MKKLSGLLSSIVLSLCFCEVASAQLEVLVNTNQAALIQSDDPVLAANKQLMYDFYINIFQTHDMSNAADYMAADYMQHNPMVPTGRDAFTGFFGSLPQASVSNEIHDLVSMVAEGDMVVLSFRTECQDPRDDSKIYTTTWFDMFRIENGKIAEHWDYGTVAGQGNSPDCTPLPRK